MKLRHLLLGRKAMTNLDSIFKSRDITLPTKLHLVKAMVFPVVMYGCESWTTKKAEHWRIDDFELWCWRELLRVPCTARKSSQSILKEISPEYSLEELMLKLKLQTLATWCKELTHWKIPWCWERLMAGGEGDDIGWDDWMASPLDGHEFEQALGAGDWQGSLTCCSPWGHNRRIGLSNCTELYWEMHALAIAAASVLTILVCLVDHFLFTTLLQHSYWFLALSFSMYHIIFFSFFLRLPSATCNHSFYSLFLIMFTTLDFEVCCCVYLP